MLKTLSSLECKIVDKVFNFTCDPNSPLEHVKEALFQFQKYVGQIEDAAKAKLDAENAEKDAVASSEVIPTEAEPVKVEG